jgi:uncharacterized protein YqjF (DUF2071 family)
MQSVATFHAPVVRDVFSYGRSGTQFLPVSGHVTDRLFVTYRADARRLLPLVPPPFTLDVHQGFGFVSVCAVEILGMGILGTPRCLRFDNREFLYRLAVRLQGESTFVTLRSDVSSPVLAVLGRYFSHYRPHLAKVRLSRQGALFRLESATDEGPGDAVLEVDTRQAATAHTSVFADHTEATEFLLGMKFSADAHRGRARVQPIEHGPWQPHFVDARRARFAFVESLERRLGTSFEYDGTLAAQNIPQTWSAARWA